jgi:hypothetical protein
VTTEPKASRSGEQRSGALWEAAGVVVGLGACATISHQIAHEWDAIGPSSVSLVFTAGFFLIYAFWCAHGLRFGRIGIWLPNAVAAMLQIAFSAIVLSKAS